MEIWKILLSAGLATPLVALLGLGIAGFGPGGIVAGSIAAASQGPAVAAGSLFAILQSIGATASFVLPGILAASGAVVIIEGLIRDIRRRRGAANS